MRAHMLKEMITDGLGDIKQLTIGEAMMLKSILGLSDSEAIAIFLGGMKCENI